MIKYIAIAPVPEKNTEDYSLQYDSDVAHLFNKFPVINLHSMNDHRLSMSLKFQGTRNTDLSKKLGELSKNVNVYPIHHAEYWKAITQRTNLEHKC